MQLKAIRDILIGGCALVVLVACCEPARAQSLWYATVDDTSGTIHANDWSIPISSDTMGAQQLTSPADTQISASSDPDLGGIAVSRSQRGYWVTNGIPVQVGGSYDFTLEFFGINHSHPCTGSVSSNTVTVRWPNLWTTDAPNIRGMAVDPIAHQDHDNCNDPQFMWFLAHRPSQLNVNAVFRRDVSGDNGMALRVELARSAGTDPFTDIAYDSDPSGPYLWAIDRTGIVERFALDASQSTWTADRSFTITGPSEPDFVGIALDCSRPMTLSSPGGTAAGTICGLNSDSTVWTLPGANLSQETWSVSGAGPFLGLDYSAELVRIGMPCNQCSGVTSATRCDIAWPTSAGEPQPLLHNSGTVPCNYGTIVIQACHVPASIPISAYCYVSSGYSPAVIVPPQSSTFPCAFYPATQSGTAVGVIVTGGLASTTIHQGGSLPIDGRLVQYVQWVFVCGTGQSFSLRSSPMVSDCIRVAWSNL